MLSSSKAVSETTWLSIQSSEGRLGIRFLNVIQGKCYCLGDTDPRVRAVWYSRGWFDPKNIDLSWDPHRDGWGSPIRQSWWHMNSWGIVGSRWLTRDRLEVRLDYWRKFKILPRGTLALSWSAQRCFEVFLNHTWVLHKWSVSREYPNPTPLMPKLTK